MPLRFDADAAGLGEFQCVADQVDQNLANARRVAFDMQCLETRWQPQVEFQAALLGAMGKCLGTAIDQFGEGKRNVFQFQRGALDAREVEDVIDHLEQVLGRLRGQRGIFSLFIVQGRSLEQLQHAQHAIHRGAQLMAHHGQELCLGVIGALGLFARLNQLRDRLLLFLAGDFQALGQVVDVLGQVAQLGIVDNGQRGLVVAFLNGLDRLPHLADRPGQAQGQPPCKPVGEHQGAQREDGSLEQDFLLPLVEGVVGHADDYPPQVIFAGVLRRWIGVLQEIAVEGDALQANWRLEHFDQLRA
ncbi:hypothetical protein D3C85_1174350 [compost metagenome]